MTSLAQIHLNYHTDKGTSHSYIETYDRLFTPFQDQQFQFLEIGALTCGSLKMFNDYFSQAQIYGVDNWAQQTDHHGQPLIHQGINVAEIIADVRQNYPRIHLVTCDSTNREAVAQQFSGQKFTIIIDDGDHTPGAQAQTFANFLPFWDHQHGIYVIEDVGDVSGVEALVKNHLSSFLGLNVQVTPVRLGKGGRGDDNLVVITPL